MSLARLWKARSYRRSEFSRVAKRDAWIISVCIWACLKNAFYGWTPSIIKFHRRAVERKYCLDQTHENVGPSFLASWLAFYLRLVQKRRENKRVRTTLRKLELLNSSWRKTNVEIQLRRAYCAEVDVSDSTEFLRPKAQLDILHQRAEGDVITCLLDLSIPYSDAKFYQNCCVFSI